MTGVQTCALPIWMTENEMVGWHHQPNGPEFEQTPGNGEGQGSLACCSPWDRKESDMTERLNNSKFVIEHLQNIPDNSIALKQKSNLFLTSDF